MNHLLSLTLAFSLLLGASPAHALFIKMPDGSDPAKFRHANRKVNIQGTKIRNQPFRERNERRKSDLMTIGNALARYRRAEGNAPKKILITEELEICRYDADNCDGLLDLKDVLGTHLETMPVDPAAEGNGTGYVVKKDYRDKVFLRSVKAEDGWLIRLQR